MVFVCLFVFVWWYFCLLFFSFFFFLEACTIVKKLIVMFCVQCHELFKVLMPLQSYWLIEHHRVIGLICQMQTG